MDNNNLVFDQRSNLSMFDCDSVVSLKTIYIVKFIEKLSIYSVIHIETHYI